MKLLDTSVLVDLDRGADVGERIGRLDAEGRHAISVVTVTELFYGVERRYRAQGNHPRAVAAMDTLLSRFDVLPVTRNVAVTAARLMHRLKEAGRPLDDLHDIYVAATALSEQRVLLTANLKHFEHIEELTALDWSDY